MTRDDPPWPLDYFTSLHFTSYATLGHAQVCNESISLMLLPRDKVGPVNGVISPGAWCAERGPAAFPRLLAERVQQLAALRR